MTRGVRSQMGPCDVSMVADAGAVRSTPYKTYDNYRYHYGYIASPIVDQAGVDPLKPCPFTAALHP